MIAQVRPADFAAWLAAVAQSHPMDAPVLLDVREPYELDWAQLVHGPDFRVLAIP
ncbi:MAG: sulfurtransferase, partial [Rhodoferax sp.]|nr:sulfurtransferase [Rhodoferax sp.]